MGKGVGLTTQRSVDRNHAPLFVTVSGAADIGRSIPAPPPARGFLGLLGFLGFLCFPGFLSFSGWPWRRAV